MVKLVSYGDLKKDADGVLSTGFIFDRLAAFTLRSSAKLGFNYHSKIGFEAGQSPSVETELNAETGLDYKGDGFNVAGVHDINKGSLTLKGKYAIPQVKEVKVSGEVSLKPGEGDVIDKSGKVAFDYAHEQVLGKLTITNDPTVKIEAVSGTENFGAGVSTAFDVESKRFQVYNAALWWFDSANKFVVSHESKDKKAYNLGTLGFSAFHQLNDTVNLAAQLNYSHGAEKNAVDLQVGVARDINELARVKGRFNSNGHVSAALRQKLHENVTLFISSDFNTKKIYNDGLNAYKIGYKVKFEGN